MKCLLVVQLFVVTWKIIGAGGMKRLVVVQLWIVCFVTRFLGCDIDFIFTDVFPFHRASRLHPLIFCCISF